MSPPAFSFATAHEIVGREVGVSGWRAVDQALIDAFAACTGDRQWIHVDVERAGRESPYGSTIAHGYLVLSLVASMAAEAGLYPAGLAQAVNYGLDRVRFLAPVRPGARVRDRVVLLSAEEKGPGRLLLKTRHTVEIEGEEKPALVAESLTLMMAG